MRVYRAGLLADHGLFLLAALEMARFRGGHTSLGWRIHGYSLVGE